MSDWPSSSSVISSGTALSKSSSSSSLSSSLPLLRSSASTLSLLLLLLPLLFSFSLSSPSPPPALSGPRVGREADGGHSAPVCPLENDTFERRAERNKKKKKEGGEEEEEEEERGLRTGQSVVEEVPLWVVPTKKRKKEAEEGPTMTKGEEEEEEEVDRYLGNFSLDPSSSLQSIFLFSSETPPADPLGGLQNDRSEDSPQILPTSSSLPSSAFQLLRPSTSSSPSLSPPPSPLEIFLSRLLRDLPRLIPNLQYYNLPLLPDFCAFFPLPARHLKPCTRYGLKESHLGQAPVDDLRVYVHGTQQICEASFLAFLHEKKNEKKKREKARGLTQTALSGTDEESALPAKTAEEKGEEKKEDDKEKKEDFKFFSSWAGPQCAPFLPSFFRAFSNPSASSSPLQVHKRTLSSSPPPPPPPAVTCPLPSYSSSVLSSPLAPSLFSSSALSASSFHQYLDGERKKKQEEEEEGSGVDKTAVDRRDSFCLWKRSKDKDDDEEEFPSSLFFSSSSFPSSLSSFSLLSAAWTYLLNKILPHTYVTKTDGRVLFHAAEEPGSFPLLPFSYTRQGHALLNPAEKAEVEQKKKKTKKVQEDKEKKKREEEKEEEEEGQEEEGSRRRADGHSGRVDGSSEESLEKTRTDSTASPEKKEEEEDFSSSSSWGERDEVFVVEVCADRRGRSYDPVYVHLPFMFNLVLLLYPYGLAPVAYTIFYSVLLASILTLSALLYIFPHYARKIRIRLSLT